MAIDVLANISANIPHIFQPEGHRLWNRVAPLASAVKKRTGISAAINWTVSNGGNTAVNPGEGDDIQASEYNQDDRVAMTLNRGIYRSSFAFTHTELAVVATMRPDMAADLIRERLRDAYLEGLAKLGNKIEQDMFSGTGQATSPLSNTVNAIVGLLGALKTTGNYAGQSLSSNAGLVSNVQASVGNVSRTILDNAFAAIQQASDTLPDFIMASPKTVQYLKGIADNQIRINDPNPQTMREFGLGRVMESMTPTFLSYNGVPIFSNSAWYQASGDGYAIMGRVSDLVLDVLPYNAWGDAVTDRSENMESSNGESFSTVDIPVKCYAVAKTGSSVKFALETELGMAVLRPNAFALITGITGFTTS